jgi:predicted ATPase
MDVTDLPGFVVLVGANGSGKSTFVDVFEFLRDCLKENVRNALQKRGGFAQVLSRGSQENKISIELKVQLDFLEEEKSRLVTYSLEIGMDNMRPVIEREILKFRRSGNKGQPFHFIDFTRGEGVAVAETDASFDSSINYEDLNREETSLKSPDILAIEALGQFKRFDAANQLRELIERWTISDLHIVDARREVDAAVAEHLSPNAENLALYAQYLKDYHQERFEQVVEKMSSRVPGVAEVITEDVGDGRVGLRFRDGSFDTGFIARMVSDGTIRMFAYLCLLHDPDPHPLMCVEEPENQLYPSLLGVLAEEFAAYAAARDGGAQVFVTTHSPDFLNAVDLSSIFWLEKHEGYSRVFRAKDNEQLAALVGEGDLPGWLWREGMFIGAHPN